MTCPTLPSQPIPALETRTDFDSSALGWEWNYIQLPIEGNYSLAKRPGYLTLKGAANEIGGKRSPTFVGRRLRDRDFRTTTEIDFDPVAENEEAGMTLVNNGAHYDLLISGRGEEERFASVRLRFGSTTYRSEKVRLHPGTVRLRIEGKDNRFVFSCSQDGETFHVIDVATPSCLSSEMVGGLGILRKGRKGSRKKERRSGGGGGYSRNIFGRIGGFRGLFLTSPPERSLSTCAC